MNRYGSRARRESDRLQRVLQREKTDALTDEGKDAVERLSLQGARKFLLEDLFHDFGGCLVEEACPFGKRQRIVGQNPAEVALTVRDERGVLRRRDKDLRDSMRPQLHPVAHGEGFIFLGVEYEAAFLFEIDAEPAPRIGDEE